MYNIKSKNNNNYNGIVYSNVDKFFGIFSISKEGFNVLSRCTFDNNNGLQHLHNSYDVYVNATDVKYNKISTIVVDEREQKQSNGFNNVTSNPVRSQTPAQMPAPINQRKRAFVSLDRQQKKALGKRQIRQRKIVIKIHNNIDNVLHVPAPPLQCTISGKLNNVSLASLLSKQRAQLSQVSSHSNNTKSINTTSINKNNIIVIIKAIIITTIIIVTSKGRKTPIATTVTEIIF